MKSDKLWGGRFEVSTDSQVEEFTASLQFDRRLAQHDIAGSKAHARMLMHCGILTRAERDLILKGLKTILNEIQTGCFQWSDQLEDVHMNIESRLIELAGDAGKKMHTARSRNDQIATDLRLFVKSYIDHISMSINQLQIALIDTADLEAETVMPGFTHLQAAQPVTCGHHIMAWVEMLERDWERLRDCRKRVNVSPLGSAALAGTGFAIDREMTAKELGFDAISNNSLDAVSDRDFIIEFQSASAICAMHLSRICEDLCLWASQRFGFVDLSDEFCTGSSIMPQKKNPDIAELVRGKSARVIGNLTAILVLMKGQALTYNRDNQEDKEPLFDTVVTVLSCLNILTRMIPVLTFHREQMSAAAILGHTTATDFADYLVKKGVPFREAHAAVGQAVAAAEAKKVDLSSLPLSTLQSVSTKVEIDIFDVLTLDGSVQSRDHIGGTAPNQVRHQAQLMRARLAKRRSTETTSTR